MSESRLFNFVLPEPLRDRITGFAADNSLSLAAAVRVLIIRGLDNGPHDRAGSAGKLKKGGDRAAVRPGRQSPTMRKES